MIPVNRCLSYNFYQFSTVTAFDDTLYPDLTDKIQYTLYFTKGQKLSHRMYIGFFSVSTVFLVE